MVFAPEICQAGAFPQDVSDAERHEQESADLAKAHASAASAYQDYYAAIKAGKEPQAAAEQYVLPAETKVGQIISDHRDTEQRILFGRMYLSDGSSMSPQEYAAQAPAFLRQLWQDAKAGKIKTDASETSDPSQTPEFNNAAQAVPSGGGRYSAPSAGSSRPETEVSGTAQVNEIDFSGPKKDPAKK